MAGLIPAVFCITNASAADPATPPPDPAQQAVDELSKKSGVKIQQDGIGNPGGRDIDTKKLTADEYRRVRAAAKELGYNVSERGDSMTITGKDGKPIKEITAHASDNNADPVGSSARDARNISGDDESFRGRIDPKTGKPAVDPKTGLPKPTVNDILGKKLADGGHALTKPPAQMTQDDLQNLGKTAKKVMDIGEVKDPVFRKQAEILHKTGDPAQAGIKDINEWQQQAKQKAVEAVRNEEAQIRQEKSQIKRDVDQAKENLKKAQASKDSGKIQAAKNKLLDARTRAIEYNSHLNGTTQKAINHGAGEVIAEANGYQKTTTPEGKTRYVNPQTGERLTQSQFDERMTKGKQIKLTSSPLPTGKTPAPTAPKPHSTTTKIGGTILLLYGAYHAVQEAAEIAVGEEKTGDSPLKTWAKTVAMGVTSLTGIQGAVDIGDDQANATVQEWKQAVQKGEISGTGPAGYAWALWYGTKAGILAAGKQALALGEGMVVTPVVEGATAVKEGLGLGSDQRMEWQSRREAMEQNQKVEEKKAEAPDWRERHQAELEGNKAQLPPRSTGSEKYYPPRVASTESTKPEITLGPGGVDIRPTDWEEEKEKEKEEEKEGKASAPGSSRRELYRKGDKKPVEKQQKPPQEKQEPARIEPKPLPPREEPPESEQGPKTVYQGYVANEKGTLHLENIVDEQGNVIGQVHTEVDPEGNVINVSRMGADVQGAGGPPPPEEAGQGTDETRFSIGTGSDGATEQTEQPAEVDASPTAKKTLYVNKELSVPQPAAQTDLFGSAFEQVGAIALGLARNCGCDADPRAVCPTHGRTCIGGNTEGG